MRSTKRSTITIPPLTRVILLACFFLLSTTTTCCLGKKDRNVGHPHRGLIDKLLPGKLDLDLSSSDESKLMDEKAVMKHIESEGGQGGTAICVQDVNAPKQAVWNQILGFNSYKGKVNRVRECGNYEVKPVDHENGSRRWNIKTKMVVSVLPGYKYEYYCDHVYAPDCDSLSWSLDYDKLSDFDDVAGKWYLEDHPKKRDCTRVFYTCDIKLNGIVPKPIKDILTKKALRDATGWVKKESEAKPEAAIPSEYAPAY